MNVRLLHAMDPNLSREDVYSLKGKREASEERETRTKAKRAEKLYALFVISSTKEREGKNACSATQAKLTYA